MKTPPFTEQIIRHFFEGKLSELENQQVLDWLSLQSSDVLEVFMGRQLDFLETNDIKDSNSLSDFSTIQRRIVVRRKQRLQILRWGTSIAASLLPLALAFLFMFSGINSHENVKTKRTVAGHNTTNVFERQNNSGSPEIFYLPDSSKVMLYQGSKVTYSLNRVNSSRQVHLSGKAFFDVRHMDTSPFTVYTGRVRTVVLGTSFLVNADAGYKRILIKVKSGKVGVIDSSKPAVFLLPRESALFRSGAGLVKLQTVEKLRRKAAMQMPESSLAFNQTPLITVINELSAAFGRQITFRQNKDSIGQMPVSMNTKGKTLSEILNEIKTQIPIDYEITRDRIIINQQ